MHFEAARAARRAVKVHIHHADPMSVTEATKVEEVGLQCRGSAANQFTAPCNERGIPDRNAPSRRDARHVGEDRTWCLDGT